MYGVSMSGGQRKWSSKPFLVILVRAARFLSNDQELV
jgi:hypothetical protein